eukprot:6179414-Pleurochrysis_carterae.AAC.1
MSLATERDICVSRVYREGVLTSCLVSLASGAVAGVVAGIVSTPADTLLTTQANARRRGETQVTVLDAGVAALKTDPLGLFRGLVPRCVLFAATIAGQYLLYDFWKRLLKVSPDDIVLVLDVFADRLSFYDDPTP